MFRASENPGPEIRDTMSRIEGQVLVGPKIPDGTVLQTYGRTQPANSYLSELTDEGRLIRLKAGLYITVEALTVSGFYEIQLALPSAIICLASALTYYDLTVYEPPAVHAAIPRDERVLPPDFPPTRRFSFGKTLPMKPSAIILRQREGTLIGSLNTHAFLESKDG